MLSCFYIYILVYAHTLCAIFETCISDGCVASHLVRVFCDLISIFFRPTFEVVLTPWSRPSAAFCASPHFLVLDEQYYIREPGKMCMFNIRGKLELVELDKKDSMYKRQVWMNVKGASTFIESKIFVQQLWFHGKISSWWVYGHSL